VGAAPVRQGLPRHGLRRARNQSYSHGDKPVFVSVRGTDDDEITTYWKGMSEGATVIQDLGPAGWAPLYGMLKDRFGVTWVLDIAVEYNAG
jgi:PhnB protein